MEADSAEPSRVGVSFTVVVGGDRRWFKCPWKSSEIIQFLYIKDFGGGMEASLQLKAPQESTNLLRYKVFHCRIYHRARFSLIDPPDEGIFPLPPKATP